MNTVDINCILTKYVNYFNERHVSLSSNISFWIMIDNDLINPQNNNLLNKYNKYFDQKNIDVIIKCIVCNIKIIPIYYKINYDNLIEIFNCALKHKNLQILRHLIKIINDNVLIKTCVNSACHDCDYNTIKFLHKYCMLTKSDFETDCCVSSCYIGYINIVKYLHKKINFTTLILNIIMRVFMHQQTII